jgi:hypothetical protein
MSALRQTVQRMKAWLAIVAFHPLFLLALCGGRRLTDVKADQKPKQQAPQACE